MLKIKDNVDLKELEKFGFSNEITIIEYRRIYGSVQVVVDIEDRYIICIDFSSWTYIDNALDILFDLIQAGLVEKVEVQDDRKE